MVGTVKEVDGIVERIKEEEIKLHTEADSLRYGIENSINERAAHRQQCELDKVNNHLNSLQYYRDRLENALMKADEE